MSAQAQAEVYEALCSALYSMPFAEFLGEKDLTEEGEHGRVGRTGWFHLGERPKDIRVEIHKPDRDAEVIEVHVDWRNYAADPRNPLRGSQKIVISTYAADQAILRGPVEDAMVRVLEIYKDVLAEEGVAGLIEKLVETPEEGAE